MLTTNHPCFNVSSKRHYGRIHLPVAPRCNIQCKFCNRQFDCVNESRPGVSSTILSPGQAMTYLDEMLERNPNIAVAGIAGPGDPFANPDETLETLFRIREKYPEMLLCIASNGLNVARYADDMARIGVTHVTVTVNAVDPEIGKRIYAWIRYGPKVLRAEEGSAILLENQLAAIRLLKAKGIAVKINAIVLPGINDRHIEDVAREMAALNVDIFNCMPYYPCKGLGFEDLKEPSPATIAQIRKSAGKHVPQMHHCTRCRSDAVGLLGKELTAEDIGILKRCSAATPGTNPEKTVRIAVASREGMLVNLHLGEAENLMIYEFADGATTYIDKRKTPEKGSGDTRWERMADVVDDCEILLASGIGPIPRKILTRNNKRLFEAEGMINDVIKAICTGASLSGFAKRPDAPHACAGGGMGCG